MLEKKKKKLYLAVGSQSGGTTLVSWCFLQHPDLDGELDMACDKIRTKFDRVNTKSIWVKMTDACFRYSEIAELYTEIGYDVVPLLVVRNPFSSFASLKKKWYGRNATTAEDPPLILRFSRFVEDWQLFKKNNWPIIKFENFLADPKTELQIACENMGLAFDSSLLDWPKPLHEIAYVNETNSTFGDSMQGDKRIISDTKDEMLHLSENEKEWIENKFSAILNEYDYKCPNLEVCDDSIAPHPFDARRYVGYGNKRELALSCRVNEALKTIKANGSRLHIYGAGEFGWYIYTQAINQGLEVKSILDSNPNKVLQEFASIPINQNLEGLVAEDSIFIGSLNSKNEIIADLMAKGIKSNLISF